MSILDKKRFRPKSVPSKSCDWQKFIHLLLNLLRMTLQANI